jgi:topoisomerase IA-like protein
VPGGLSEDEVDAMLADALEEVYEDSADKVKKATTKKPAAKKAAAKKPAAKKAAAKKPAAKKPAAKKPAAKKVRAACRTPRGSRRMHWHRAG